MSLRKCQLSCPLYVDRWTCWVWMMWTPLQGARYIVLEVWIGLINPLRFLLCSTWKKTAACYFRLQKHIFPIADVPQDSFKLACKTNCAYYRFARKEAKCVPFLTEASQDLSSILHRHLPATDLWDKANAGQAQSFTIDAIKAELRDGKIRSLKVECNANLLQRIDF